MREMVTPHPEEDVSPAILREQFREDHRLNLRSQMSKHPLGWGVIGDTETARDKFSGEGWAREILRCLDSPVSQDFGLDNVPFTVSIRLEEQAQRSILHESVTWDDETEGVVDHDAPECQDVREMTDDELADYVDRSIRESARG